MKKIFIWFFALAFLLGVTVLNFAQPYTSDYLFFLPHSMKSFIQNFHQKQFNIPFSRKRFTGRETDNKRWARLYGGDQRDFAYGISQTSDGGFIVSGMTDSFGSNAWVLKLSSFGNIEWQRAYGGEKKDGRFYTDITQRPDGGYILSTNTESYASKRAPWILKLSPNGNIEWQYVYDIYYGGSLKEKSNPRCMIPLDNGNYLIGGTSTNTYQKEDMVIFEIDPLGNVVWAKKYDFGRGIYRKILQSLVSTKDGNLALSFSFKKSSRFVGGVMKIDQKGNILWQKRFSNPGRNYYYSAEIASTSDGGLILLDFTDLLGEGLYDYILTRMDSEGNVLWQKVYGGPDEDWYASDIQGTDSGGFIFTGLTQSFIKEKANQFWVVNLDPKGNIIWQKAFVYSGGGQGYRILQADDGDFVVSGRIGYGCYSDNDFGVLKLSSSGKIGTCPFLKNTSAGVTEGKPEVKNLSLIAEDIAITKRQTQDEPRSTVGFSQLLGWNLHQPPENVTVTPKSNKSFLKTESLNQITWDHNSWNKRFDVTHYRIYKRDSGDDHYELVAEIPGSTTQYIDGPIGKGTPYYYMVSVVEGVESPPSETVK